MPGKSSATIREGFPIVGIGASAGGLAAFEKFFANMPADTESGMAFVLVQHLAPDHKSILTDLIKRYTRMEVYEVHDGIKVMPNCAYIIPPNRDMALLHGELYLTKQFIARGLRLPIDFFFRSLAQDQREHAICIVLSGSGSDGTLGLRAVKGEGGMVMAQNPESAEYDGMPRSAIATGLVDYVLPPDEMPAQLIAYTKHTLVHKALPNSPPTPKAASQLKKIFIQLRAKTGHDFTYYKQNTIIRRIERRLAVNQIERLEDYASFLQENPLEIEALFRDLLIGVTSFFRDPEAFNALKDQAIPRLFDNIPRDGAVRVWVPGCSTGEEAYSIAMLIQEYIETQKQNYKVQVFATDIDSQAIEKARAGIYPASIATDVSTERLGRFFIQHADGSSYQIQKFIRDMMIFSEQDMIVDPPFSRLDLISCRNLLIYMDVELQKKVISLFHYALKQSGFLFLGNSESIGEFTDLFNPVNRKWKLYQRKAAVTTRPVLTRDSIPLLPKEALPARATAAGRREISKSIRELTEQALLRQYAPAAVVINERGEIIYIHGRTGKYLEPALGEASVDIVRMAREGLRRELTSGIRKVVAKKEPVHYEGLRIKENGDRTIVNLTIQPVAGQPGDQPGLLLVTFKEVLPEEEVRPQAAEETVADGLDTQRDEKIKALEQELQEKEEYLQSTIEELETSTEELQSTNEEMQSANEELQSTNEELETSKEELQSINEELSTVNAELQQKVDDLSRVSNDMHNLLIAINVGTVFVDHQLCVKFFNPAAAMVFNFIQTDVGRPLGHVVSNLVGYDGLVEDIQAVLRSLAPREMEVQTRGGSWYLMRILPYRTLENVINGAVITFVDITERKQFEEALRQVSSLRRLATVVRDSNDAITVHDLDGRIIAWNPVAERMYGWSESEALTMNISETTPQGLRKDALAMIRKLAQGSIVKPFSTQRLAKSGHPIDIWLTATALTKENGEIYAIATTERKKGNRERKKRP